jgi:putative membrane protein
MLGNGYGNRHSVMYGDMGTGGWLAMSLLMIVCLAAIISVIYLLVRKAAVQPASSPMAPLSQRPAAEATLDDRFARGEIDETEYLKRRSVLRNG